MLWVGRYVRIKGYGANVSCDIWSCVAFAPRCVALSGLALYSSCVVVLCLCCLVLPYALRVSCVVPCVVCCCVALSCL